MATTSTAEIQTFLFFDLETTGLDRKKDRITEIAMIAVDRDDFISSVRNNCALPRVLQKLCMIINPTIKLHEKAAEVSKLNNNLLNKQQNFLSAFANIPPFLARLPSPVCLVAHNGVGYDLPLFKNELARYDLKIDENLLILDTLSVLKKIDVSWRPDWLRRKPVKTLIQNNQIDTTKNVANGEQSEPMNEIVIEDKVNLNDADKEAAVNLSGADNRAEVNVNGANAIQAEPNTQTFTAIYDYKINYGDRIESWRSPPKKVLALSNIQQQKVIDAGSDRSNGDVESTSDFSENRVTVVREALRMTSIQADVSDIATTASSNITKIHHEQAETSTQVPISVTVDDNSSGCASSITVCENATDTVTSSICDCLAKRVISQLENLPGSYSQPSIYRRLFNVDPDEKAAHTAEGDCLSLLEIVLNYGEDFIKAADKFAVKI